MNVTRTDKYCTHAQRISLTLQAGTCFTNKHRSLKCLVAVLPRDGVSLDGIWFGNWVYWTLTDPNY
jgi:hypothetical protein